MSAAQKLSKKMTWHELSDIQTIEKRHYGKAGKPTASPTLRWVFQCFMAVHLVVFQDVQQVVNLTHERRHILQFLSQACRRYYLLPSPDS